jgi:hypothetical protein
MTDDSSGTLTDRSSADDFEGRLSWLRAHHREDLNTLGLLRPYRRQEGLHLEASGPRAVKSLTREIVLLDVVQEAVERSMTTAGVVSTALVNDFNSLLRRYRHRDGYRPWRPDPACVTR